MRSVSGLCRLALVALLAAVLAPACSLGEGSGAVCGTLNAPACWSGPFDLKPNFFAAVPTNSSALEIRVQNGIDFQSFSDGMIVIVDDVGLVRGDPLPDGMQRTPLLGQWLAVGAPPGVTPPGVPITPQADPPIVHASVFLDRTCRTQNVALFALSAVSLEADGTCNRPDSGEPAMSCGASPAPVDASTTEAGAVEGGTPVAGDAAVTGVGFASAPASVMCAAASSPSGPPGGVAQSSIRFNSLFDGNAAETNAAQRLTDAQFDFYLGDPRDACPGGLGPPPRCRGHLTGSFRFYFQRGRPAQAFP